MNIMTSLPLLNNQVCAIYSHTFSILKSIFAHIQNNARDYEMVSIFVACLNHSEFLHGSPGADQGH